MPLVVGIDGYRRGWVAIRLRDGAFDDAAVGPGLQSLEPFLESADAIGVDMPLGLPMIGYRQADVEARAFVGRRRGSVFLTMPRSVWLAADIESARALSVASYGRSFSTQLYALRDRVIEVDLVAAADRRFHEIHPEVSFREIAGRELEYAKSTWSGIELRRFLLRSVGIEVPTLLGPAGAAGVDDVLDAAVAAWSADRIARGLARSIPSPPEAIPEERPTAIWY